MSSIILNPFQLLEMNVISAQDLAMVTRTMRTYAVAWVHPDRKLSTRVDYHGRNNPTWNDKFVFRVDEEFLRSDTSGVMIEIYAKHWFRDVLVGRVRVLVGHLVTPPPQPYSFRRQRHVGMRFVALQVRRPSGRPQGILNIGVAVLDSSMRSMPLLDASAVGYRDLMGKQDPDRHHNNNSTAAAAAAKTTKNTGTQLRRTMSDTSSMMGAGQVKTLKRKVSFRHRPHSVINDSEDGSPTQERRKKKKESNSRSSSIVNGSRVGYKQKTGSDLWPDPKPDPKAKDMDMAMITALDFEDAPPSKPGMLIITESELGPSPSEVAAAVAAKERNKVKDVESPVVDKLSLNESVEGLQSKLERWRMELPTVYDRGAGYSSLLSSSGGNNGNSSIIVKSKPSNRRHVRRHTDGGGVSLFSCVKIMVAHTHTLAQREKHIPTIFIFFYLNFNLME
ncbi:hypothetical protein BT93_L1152 [Corymbia citriodora subsp. variegata]|uniref:C2 domain-containing protein n=1 Tax=Corymbia citriodora subsp. variegata TaxID=360336 RepID=A0A8T0CSV4_CORYI|nr:hypothetical protein BT93_L1152 [Corymbia citriodora subsp. variegata]